MPRGSPCLLSYLIIVLSWGLSSCSSTAENATIKAPLTEPPAAEPVLGHHLWQTRSIQPKEVIQDQPTLNFEVDNLPATQLLKVIELETGLRFEADACGLKPVTARGVAVPLKWVLSSIRRQTGSIVEFSEGVIRMRCDHPHLKIYTLDYLALSRRMQDESRLDSNLGQRNAPSHTAGNQSAFRLSNEHTHDVWRHLVSQIEMILDQEQAVEITRREKTTREDQQKDYRNNRGLESVADRDKTRHDLTITRKQTLSGRVVAHPESGTLAITATHAQHQLIAQWLSTVQARLTQQVAIDAVIAEVTLRQAHQTGIDWALFQRRGTELGLSIQGLDVPQTSFALQLSRSTPQSDTSLALKLLEEFGRTSVVSAPRIVVMNQQAAVLKLIDNRVFFTTEVQTTAPTANTAAFSTFKTEVQTVPVGFLMTVTPMVARNRSVQLRVRPTLTRILGFVPDPNPALAELNIVSQIPEIQTRELESILRIQNGELVLLGGLKQSAQSRAVKGLPGTSGWAADLTDSNNQQREQTELVVLIRTRILDKATYAPDLPVPGLTATTESDLNRLLHTATELQTSSPSQAYAFLKRLHEHYPDSPAVLMNLSILSARHARYDQAGQWLALAEENCPTPACPLPLLQWEALLTTVDHEPE